MSSNGFSDRNFPYSERTAPERMDFYGKVLLKHLCDLEVNTHLLITCLGQP
jgi:hypothetical protein